MTRSWITMIALVISLPVITSTAHAKQPSNLAKNPGFERSMDGWKTKGPARFEFDSEVKHSGKQALKITVDPSEKLDYQQVNYTMPVKPGQVYSAGVWVRYTDLRDGMGAYGVLDFWNGTERLSHVPHTDPIPNLNRPNEWHRIDVVSEVPEKATEMRLALVLHSHGTAWFDDAQITKIADVPKADHIPVKLTLKQEEIITDGWQGFGAQGDLFMHTQRLKDLGVDDADRSLVYQRITDMRPQIIRLAVNLTDWEDIRGKLTPDSDAIQDLRETLALYKEIDADIQLTEWGYRLPDWCRPSDRLPHPDETRAFTDSWVSLIKYLRSDCGFMNIRYITILNEPNGVPFDRYAAMYRSLDASLKAADLRKAVSIVGPDEACGHQLLLRAIKDMDDVIDYYDAHNYTSNNGYSFGIWTAVRTGEMPTVESKSMHPARKRFMITEFGMLDGMDTWFTPHNHEYDYGIFLADSAISACREGVSALMNWCLMDTEYGTNRMKWGLWRFKDEQWEPRPGFYAWSLITRYTERGSTVHPLVSNSVSAPAVAFKSPKGIWTLMTANRLEETRPLKIAGLPKDSKWQPFIYCRDTVPTADRKMIQPGQEQVSGTDGKMTMEMPPRSFILWRQIR
ncbi:MAG: carbohydrate binding domain-containing protein [Armatimonadota bacterium]